MTEKMVQRLSDNEFVPLRSLKVGDKFIEEKKVWQVEELKPDGCACAQDSEFFLWDV